MSVDHSPQALTHAARNKEEYKENRAKASMTMAQKCEKVGSSRY